MFSSVSSGIGATACRFLLVAPLTKLEEEEVEGAASVAPVGKTKKTLVEKLDMANNLVLKAVRIKTHSIKYILIFSSNKLILFLLS